MTRPLDVFLVTGEHSGDQLGYKLMRALRDLTGGDVRFQGVGGTRMEGEGLHSLFPLEDIAVMGFGPVIARLPLLMRRIRETVAAVIAARPDVLVIVDSPDFTHRVARGVRAVLPELPVVDYVSPTVWAWRPGRAARMRAYVDHVLAVLPFEPEAHRRLGGPACSYVGHPLIERLGELRPAAGERKSIDAGAQLLVLPGSRTSVMRRHMALFGDVLVRLGAQRPPEVIIPTSERLRGEVEALAAAWPVPPRVVVGEEAKLAAFRGANAALAASGTVTLELALSGVPMVGAYQTEWLFDLVRKLVPITAKHVLLPNLILDAREIPEFAAENADPVRIAEALLPLLSATPVRAAQADGLARLDGLMAVPEPPSLMAARIVLQHAGRPA